ncbi:MAG: hypothetical protein J6Y53_02550 [Alphaproteobacteria bacterium]|nr:hypothetical protein [Alphaproteobacteria bacterium]
MNKKVFFILAFWIIVASLSVFLFTPDLYSPDNPLPEQISRTNKIILDSENSIIKSNGIWNSPENDFYPVNNELVENILSQLKQASVYAAKRKINVNDSIKITLEDGINQKLELFIRPEKEEIIALYKKQYYTFSGKINIPLQPYQWFTQPLFPLSDSLIQTIEGVEKDKFSFSDLTFLQATKENYFADWDQKQIYIKTTDGMKLYITLYTQNRSYWLSAKMDTTIMPTKDTKYFIDDNNFLYDGWFFEIPQPIGSKLFSD